MPAILSEAKDPTYEAWMTHVRRCDQRSLCEVPLRLRGLG
jgi:hypothetical protein